MFKELKKKIYDEREIRIDVKNIPKKITRNLYVMLGVGEWNNGKIALSDFDATPYTSNGSEAVHIGFAVAEITTFDEIDVKGELIKTLEAEKQKILAENHVRLKNVQDRIDNLLAIEYKGDENV